LDANLKPPSFPIQEIVRVFQQFTGHVGLLRRQAVWKIGSDLALTLEKIAIDPMNQEVSILAIY
jgi:hypothetical protein